MGQVVRAVIRKELQQNWITLALVICLEFIIVFTSEWFRSGWLFDSRHEFHNILLYSAVRSAITLGCATAGLLLGILQPLADRNFDLWAFLTHRPVPRWWLYAGRALAGVILYLLAAGVPVAFALALAPTHWGGRFFLASYTLPPIADWCAGLVYYFAGLLIMERQARWYGSRVVPLFVVIAGSLWVATVFSFWTALAAILLLLALYILASMGSAISHGYALRAPRWAHVTLLLAIFASFSSLIFASAGAGFARDFDRQSTILNATDNPSYWTQTTSNTVRRYVLLEDGTFVIWNSRSEYQRVDRVYKWVDVWHSWTDVEGHPLPDKPDFWESGSYDYSPRQINLGSQPAPDDYGYRATDNEVESFSHEVSNEFQTTWYWVRARGIAYLYREPVQNGNPAQAKIPSQFLGTVGANGFNPPDKTAAPFESPSLQNGHVMTPHALYSLDMETRQVKLLLSLPANENLLQMGYERVRGNKVGDQWQYSMDEKSNLVLRTSRRILCLSPTGDVLVSLALPETPIVRRLGIRHLLAVHRWVIEDLHIQDYSGGRFKEDPAGTFYFYDDQGRLLDTQHIPVMWEYTSSPPQVLRPRAVRKLHKLNVEAGLWAATTNPLLTCATPWIFGNQDEWRIQQAHAALNIVQSDWRFWLSFLALALAYGIAAWMLTRFYALPRHRWLWTLLSILCGPAILLTFLATHRLSIRTRCPKCGRRRLQRADRCEKCGAPWPTPAPTGTEIWGADNPIPAV
jgi:hypothetical protein